MTAPNGTFKCITHQQDQQFSVGSLSVDLNPLLKELRNLSSAIKEINPVVKVEPPVINYQPPQINMPEIKIPEISPKIEILPAEVVMQNVDGAILASHKLKIEIPKKTVIGLFGAIIVIQLVDLYIKIFGLN